MLNHRLAACTLVLLVPGLAAAGMPPDIPGDLVPPSPGLLESHPDRPVIRVAAAWLDAAAEIEALREHNLVTPLFQDGFSRRLPIPLQVRLDRSVPAGPPEIARLHAGGLAVLEVSGDLVWGTEVQVEGSYRLRLHLSDANLPEGSILWVEGSDPADRTAIGFPPGVSTANVEAIFDDIPVSCNGPLPGHWPIVRGVAIVQRVPETDTILLRLRRVPPGRTPLAYDDEGYPISFPSFPSMGETMHRLSHACGGPMTFSVSGGGHSVSHCGSRPAWILGVVDDHNVQTATGLETRPYAVWGGSSGSALLGESSTIYGQLWGMCPDSGPLHCSEVQDYQVEDGSIAVALPYLRRYLDPAHAPTAPVRLRVALVGGNRARLTWSVSSPPPTPVFVVERAGADGVFAEIARTNVPNYLTASLGRGTYRFQVTVYNSYSYSLPSAMVSVTVR